MAEHEDDTAAALNVLLEDTPEFTDPRLAICLACLKRTIPASVFNKLLAGSFNILLIEVPGADWVNWVAAAAREVLRGSPLFIRTASRAGKKPSAEFERLVEVVTKQGGVIAIVESGDLPEEASKVADYRYKLRLPDRSALREVARRTLVGDHTRIKAGLDRFCELSLLGACFPPGGTVSATVARLQRLTGSSQNTAAEMPPLASLQGLDAAKEWGIDLKADLTAYRSGDIPFSAIEAGAVLAGPPGTGKTMVAGIIARECGLHFVQTSIGTLFATSDGHLDGVIKKFRSIFDEARQLAPSLLFIDELDALPSRETLDAKNKDWWTPVITDFLVQLDSSLNDRDGVVVLGATNRYQDLDPALVRPGRLSRMLQIDPPSPQALAGILRHFLGGDLGDDDLLSLAMLTKGATGAAAAEWVSSARRTARNAGRALRHEDLWNAAIGRDYRTSTELWRIAIHEAGHCISGHVLGRIPTFVTIRQVGSAAGHTRFDEVTGFTRRDFERAAIVMLGGQAAERVILGGEVTMGAGGNRGSDLHVATEVVAQGYASFGWGDALVWRTEPKNAVSLLSKDSRLLEAVAADLGRYAKVAENLIQQHADTCRDLATILMAKLSLSAEELETFLRTIPPSASSDG
ncbi:AAA family ATPase [Devosia sp. 1566]|uniref:AAA family ATPase n=1 Tax=Devosia sp. 1566 TaxID=2499144 RepID=UPI0013E34743|nr:AAA family ATPase [Devosia sp. 1566]